MLYRRPVGVLWMTGSWKAICPMVTSKDGAGRCARTAALQLDCWNLKHDWAATTMRIVVAQKQDKHLSIFFEASEIMCLAELLKYQQDLRSISIYGEVSSLPLAKKPDSEVAGYCLQHYPPMSSGRLHCDAAKHNKRWLSKAFLNE
ncbi:hypothetical protein ABBQ32_010436 [Trebouxia sp. C0010 RCD-2024]